MPAVRRVNGVEVTSGDTSTARLGAPVLSPPSLVLNTQRPPVLTP